MLLHSENLEICGKYVSLQCVFHSIRFKVNKKDWLSGIDSLFYALYCPSIFHKYISSPDSFPSIS